MHINLTKLQDVDGTYPSIDWSHIQSKYTNEGTELLAIYRIDHKRKPREH